MPRVFTTFFTYKGETHTAIISQIDGSITITVADPMLRMALPDGKVVYNKEQGFQISSAQLTPAQDLIIAILAALEENNSKIDSIEGTDISNFDQHS